MHARQRSIDNAVNFFNNRRGFAGVQLQVMKGRDEWSSGISGQEQALASPQRLQAVLRLVDIRAEAYLTLVDDVAAQNAFMAMMNSFTDQAWQDYVGFSVYQAPPMQDDPNYTLIRERGRHWVAKSYERRDAEERRAQEPSNAASDMPEKPTVFISYSWDDESHKKWVLELAKRLRCDGIDAIIDQTHMHLGGDSPQFMEKSITESRYVLVVCTKKYKACFDGRIRGSGYEGHIITAQMVNRVGAGKFIPVLRDENWETALPIALDGIFGANLSKDSDDEYTKLLAHLHGINTVEPVGNIPEWLRSERIRKQPTTDPSAAAASSAGPIDLALMSEKRNSDLVVWLHNHGLEPIEKCRLTLTNLQRFSPAHGEFQRNPFRDTLIIRPQTINAGYLSNEAVPLAGFQQTTKRTLLLFRSFPHESEVVLLIELRIEGGGRSRTETKFISWTPGEDPEFIDDPRSANPATPTPPFITPPEYGEQRKRLPDSEMMKKIWTKPRWCIWSRPERFKKARFRDLDHCAQFVASASVHSSARWTQYPWFSSTPEYGNEWIAGEIELDDSTIKHLERWVLFRSGQFVHNLALDEMPVFSGRTHVLEILNMATAVFEFIGRMADQKLISDGTAIGFEFQRVEGWQLTWPQDVSQISDAVDRNSWCQDESFAIDNPYSTHDLINHRRQLALEASLMIYAQFGWTNPPREELQKLQLNKFGHPLHL